MACSTICSRRRCRTTSCEKTTKTNRHSARRRRSHRPLPRLVPVDVLAVFTGGNPRARKRKRPHPHSASRIPPEGSPAWTRQRTGDEPFDEGSARMSWSAGALSHPPARHLALFSSGKSAQKKTHPPPNPQTEAMKKKMNSVLGEP